MFRRGLGLPALLLGLTAFAGDARPPSSPSILGESYTLEARVSFPAGLLHWLDSLAALGGPGMTSGKTREAHRRQFEKRFGRPSPKDTEMLSRFREVRIGFSETHRGKDRDVLTETFFGADDLESALRVSAAALDDEDHHDLAESVRHFAPYYERIWKEGRAAKRFLNQVRESPARSTLDQFLGDVARFYGVGTIHPPQPTLVVLPVPDGYGTHAQAIGPYLLLEVRVWEGLKDQVAPIVHENAHFLYFQMPDRERLRKTAEALGDEGRQAWQLLLEALPTAIGQGVADERFRREHWSMRKRWYHREEVDAYAKRLYPLVALALENGERFDEKFVKRAVAAYTDETIRRSP